MGLPPATRLLHLGRRPSTVLPTQLFSLFGTWIFYFGCFLCSAANLFLGFLIFSVIVCDSVASTCVLRFVGPNSIRVWSFPWNSGSFLSKNPIF